MSKSKKNIAFVSTDWSHNETRKKLNLYGGVSYYRLIKPLEYLKEWYDCRFYGSDIQKLAEGKTTDQFYHQFVKDHDIIYIKHLDNPQAIGALSFYCKMLAKPLIMDLDDNLWEVREDQPAYKSYKAEQQRSFMAAAVTMADAIFCSTVPLKETCERYNKNVFNVEIPTYVLPNCNDIKDFKESSGKSEEFLIGWQGSTTHNADLKLVLPILDKLMQKYPQVYVQLLGGIEESSLKELFKDWSSTSLDRLSVLGGTDSWKGYPELLAQQKWNLGIAPLVDEPFNRSKSHIKWMEYATQMIPCIASDVYPYNTPIQLTGTIEHGKTGWLCKPDEWEKTLVNLIENPQVLPMVGQAAHDKVLEKWQWKDHIHKWHEAIEEVIKNYKDQSASVKKELLKPKRV
jgi:glycosyltransferase involved in cell wall biosynthesis